MKVPSAGSFTITRSFYPPVQFFVGLPLPKRPDCSRNSRARFHKGVPMKSVLKSLTLAAALALATVGAAQADVVVSSKIDTEGSVLGNIILLTLNANGIKTQDRIQLGATPVVRK